MHLQPRDQPIENLVIADPETLKTKNDVVETLRIGRGAGNYFLGILYPENPITGNIGGMCLFMDKTLAVTE